MAKFVKVCTSENRAAETPENTGLDGHVKDLEPQFQRNAPVGEHGRQGPKSFPSSRDAKVRVHTQLSSEGHLRAQNLKTRAGVRARDPLP